MRIQVSIEDISMTAQALQEMSEAYAQCIQAIMSQMNEIQSVWQGVDSQAYLSSAAQLQPQMNEMKQVIDSYAQVLAASAQAYSDLQANRTASARLL